MRHLQNVDLRPQCGLLIAGEFQLIDQFHGHVFARFALNSWREYRATLIITKEKRNKVKPP